MIMQKIREFMYGRNGTDGLSIGLFAVGFLIYIVYVITGFWPLYVLSLVFYGIDVFRMLSRNIPQRQKENQKFMSLVYKAKNLWGNMKCKFEEQKTYKHFKCPKCSQKLRIPRGRGKVEIHCPKCGETFMKKS